MSQLLVTVDRVDRQIERTERNLDQLSTEMRARSIQTDRQIERTQHNLDQLSTEMRDFKDEMRESSRSSAPSRRCTKTIA
ncbi:MAG: hypothetical protein ACE5HA_14020 [Anaerolineae bacterium]